MISYATTGTEDLPNEEGELEPVTMAQFELRTGYTTVDPTTWAKNFFNSTASCFFKNRIVYPQGSERVDECSTPPGANASVHGGSTATPGHCDCPACPGGSKGKGSGDDEANGVEIGSLVLIVFVAVGLATAGIYYMHARSSLAPTSKSAY